MKKVLNILLIALILTILWILFLVMKPSSSDVQGIKSVKTKYDKYYAEIDKKIESEFDKNPQKLYEERKNSLRRLNLNLGFNRVVKYLGDDKYIFGFTRNGKLIFVLKKDKPDSDNGVVKYLYDNQSLKEIGYVEGKNFDFSGKVQFFDEEGILRNEYQYYKGKLEGLEKVFSEDGKLEEEMKKIQGEQSDIGWGNQIRSYVFQPYALVKDHRTNTEIGNVKAVMDGSIDDFINSYLRWIKNN